MTDKYTSPIDWYVASYIIRFIGIGEEGNDDPDNRFLAWENTIIVKATSIEEAYDKVEVHAKTETEPYNGAVDGARVQWLFEGVTELLPIYEKFDDCSEIMFLEHKSKKLKTLKKMVSEKHELCK